jgi:LysM repeat protein
MAAQTQTYTVKGGDNLVNIAQNIYQNPRMFAEIMRLNGLTSGVIRPGMVLRLPAPKQNEAIMIQQNSLDMLKAENEYVKQNNKIPTSQELSLFMNSGGAGFDKPVGGVTGIPAGMTQEQYMSRYRTATQSPNGTMTFATPVPYAPAPTTPAPTTSTTSSIRGVPAGYTSAMSPEAAAAYGARNRGEVTELMARSSRPGQQVLGVNFPVDNIVPRVGEPLGSISAYDRYSYRKPIENPTNLQNIASFGRSVGIATYPLIRATNNFGLQVAKEIGNVAAAGSSYALYKAGASAYDWLNQTAYTTPSEAPTKPVTPTPIVAAAGQNIGFQKPGTSYNPQKKTTFDTMTPFMPQNAVAKKASPLNADQVKNIAQTPSEIYLFNKAYEAANGGAKLTTEEANQFAFVFNITDPTFLNNLGAISSGVVAPLTNNESMQNIYESLNTYTPYTTPPTEWIIGGGGGGGGGGNAPGYSGGGTMTWGGLR